METIEEVIYKCRVAVKNEKSRRTIQDEIERLAKKQEEKTKLKDTFKKKKRLERLINATPYMVNSSGSIGHEN